MNQSCLPRPSNAALLPSPETRPSRLPVLLLWVGTPILLAALMAWYALRARALAGEFGFPLDDSWIHFRFAENLAAGKGFSFNPGVPTGLTTSPLWTSSSHSPTNSRTNSCSPRGP